MIFRILNLNDCTDAQLRQWFQEADAERRAGILQKKNPLAQKQSLCADHLARELLAEACGCERVEFRRLESGKLTAPSLPVDFSLSHSGSFVACAVHEAPVGIDIEALREIRPQLAKRTCSTSELDYIYSGGSFDSARFLQIWTAKEAVLKLRGTGIAADLRAISVADRAGLRFDGLRFYHSLTADYALTVVYQ